MPKSFSIMFYNTENFYDFVDDPLTLDDEYTLGGFREWTSERFENKVSNLTNVIKDIVKPELPDVIGLAEIENRSVIMNILDNLKESGVNQYNFIHYDSPDERGVDVALIYNRESFTVLKSTPILIRLPGIEDRTRDILYVKGELNNREILHIFVCHFPSRGEGTEKSERRRYFVASELKNEVYKILNVDALQNILIMGDFNDTPDDNSIFEILGAKKDFNIIDSLNLYNLLYPRFKKGIGSTYHDGWLLFDQFIVSGNILKSENIDCKAEYADVFNPRYLLYFDRNNHPQPNRTYKGKYIGGYSDHLPIFMRIYLR